MEELDMYVVGKSVEIVILYKNTRANSLFSIRNSH